MKYRTDFVTNSSSSSFAITLYLDFAEGQPVKISFYRFSGDAEECRMEYKEKSFITDDGYTDYEGDPVYVDCQCMPFAQIVGKGNFKTKLKYLTNLFDKEDVYYYDEEEDEEKEEERGIFDEINDEYVNDISQQFLNASSLTGAELQAEFGGRGEMLYGCEEIVDHLFYGKMASELKEHIPEYGQFPPVEEVAAALKTIKGMDIYDEESINKWAKFFVECDVAPDECIINQTFDGKKIHATISW